MSFDPGQSGNPYRTPFDTGGYAPPPSGATDVPMILGIISIVLGVMAVPLSFCCCFVGLAPGVLAIIFGGVAIAMPPPPGSIGRYLGIGGLLLGLVPVLWVVVWSIMVAVSPRPVNNNNNPFQFNPPPFTQESKTPPAANAPPSSSGPKDETITKPGGGLFPPQDGGEIKLPEAPAVPESTSPDSKPGP